MFTIGLVERVLDKAPVARLAQIDDGGRAQVLPFVFVRVDRTLWSPVDAKPKKHARLSRLAWIAARPEVCVLVDYYGEDWSRLWWLKLYARAEVIRNAHPQRERAIAGLAQKYDQYPATPMFYGEPTMIRMQWHAWKAWSASGTAAVEAWLATSDR